MLDLLTVEQLNEWQAYDLLEPIGERRADYRLALLRATIVNIARAVWGSKGTKPISPMDLMPIWDQEEAQIMSKPKKQSAEEMKNAIKNIASFVKLRFGSKGKKK